MTAQGRAAGGRDGSKNMPMRFWCELVVVIGSLVLSSCATTERGAARSASEGSRVQEVGASPARRGDGYYLSTCARCDRLLGSVGVAVDRVVGVRELRFCTPECETAFVGDLDAGTRHIDEVMARDQLPLYPIRTSIVSGKPMGEKVEDYVWCNRLVRLAEREERAAFLREPERYVAALDEQVLKAQEATYGMANRCPVQGDILSSDTPIDFVIANRMIRVCCARCVRSVRARPYQYLAMIDYANREARERGADFDREER